MIAQGWQQPAGHMPPPPPVAPPYGHQPPPPPGPFPGQYPPPAPHLAGPWLPRPRPRPRRSLPVLWFGWVLASMIGGVLAALLIGALDAAVEGTGELDMYDEPQIFLLRFLLAGTFGCLLGIGQAMALPMRGGSRFLWWMVTAAGFALAYPAAYQWGNRVIELVVDPFADTGAAWVRFRIFFILGALIGGSVSLVQTLLLIAPFRRWWAWPAVSALAMGMAMGLYYAGAVDSNFAFEEYGAGLIVAITLLYAMITGTGLLLLDQRRDRT